VSFANIANLTGGALSDSFDFNPGGTVSGNIHGSGGNDLLNYANESIAVTANLATGAATGVGGSISNIQGVVGGSGQNTLVGAGRCLLIGGAGPAQLTEGSSDSLVIAGTTIYDLQDAALESILDEWDRTDLTFAQRAAHLQSGGGLNGSNVLTLATVNGNGKVDTIVGGLGQAWIMASAYDVVPPLKSNDQLTKLSS
jgi:hypothetical protein